MDEPDIPKALAIGIAQGQIEPFDLTKVTYFTGHETIIPSGRRPGLPRWREAIFALMHHNAQRPGAFFNIPSAQIMEIGSVRDLEHDRNVGDGGGRSYCR